MKIIRNSDVPHLPLRDYHIITDILTVTSGIYRGVIE